MRREVPAAILFITGLIMMAERFLRIPSLSKVGGELRSWGIVIAAFALGVSAFNLVLVHVRNIKASRNVLFSSLLLISLGLMAALGIFAGTNTATYRFWYNSLLVPMSSATYAMLAFYIASAASRAFMARTSEAAVLLISAVLLMIGNVPIGEMIYPDYRSVSSWILNVPNLAGQRGVMISAAIGGVATSLRVLVGVDRTHFGGLE